MDDESERKVAQWKEAKAQSDYATADRLREELREAGHDPDPRRGGSRSHDPDVEDKIQQWQNAKHDKDYDTADAIRAELREQGVDPDRPKGSDAGSMPSPMAFLAQQMGFMPNRMTSSKHTGPYNAEAEAEMDRWEDAKANKDYATADAIRLELRKRGRSPSKERLKATVFDMVNQWQRAKKAKDYKRSDRLREMMREQGVEPEYMSDFMPFMQPEADSKYGSRTKSAPRSLSTIDGDALDELEQWYAAKDDKNYEAADKIRAELRKKGIEPDNCQRPGSAGLDEEMEEEVRQWFEARDAKNYNAADQIREGLRAKGVEPSQCQRPESSSGYGKVSSQKTAARSKPYQASADTSFDYETETKMDEWWKYKQEKNYAKADQIRAELRTSGIEPGHHRPRR